MNDVELLKQRIEDLKENHDRLSYMHYVMVQTLRDISNQSKESNEKALARMCLVGLELDQE